MRRVLIVAPHFAPVSAPDSHRVRMALPFFAHYGWEAHVLTVHPTDVAAPTDTSLQADSIPHTTVTRIRIIPRSVTKLFSSDAFAWRALLPLAAQGTLLLLRKFDIVFFSSTCFLSFALGPLWMRLFRIPYVLDFQDPWRASYTGNSESPPGGRVKFRMAQLIAARLEGPVVRHASHIVAVSPGYIDTLACRYPGWNRDRSTVLPFGTPLNDFEGLTGKASRHHIFDRHDGNIHIVYAGRGGEDMHPFLRTLFEHLRALRRSKPQLLTSLRLHFVGTSYAESTRTTPSVLPIATECGCENMVTEYPTRIPYGETLSLLLDSHGLLLIGSSDNHYNPSKIGVYLATQKPILAVAERQSHLTSRVEQRELCFTLCADSSSDVTSHETLTQFLITACRQETSKSSRVQEHETAASMTRLLCAAFDRTIQRGHTVQEVAR